MGLRMDYLYGQTPVDEDERDGLLIPSISTKAELDEFEQQNIEDAMLWVYGRKLTIETVFSEKFILQLHRKMFGSTWDWAGQFRKTNKNIGIDKWHIPMELRTLCGYAMFWCHEHTFSPDEIAIRFKHQIVAIHCFPNGNGRHSRLMADIIVEKLYGRPPFSWGSDNISAENETRHQYLKALKEADRGNFEPLLAFARS